MGLSPYYLLDKSAWEQRQSSREARSRIDQLREAHRLTTCIITIAEVLYSSRNADEMTRDYERLSQLRFLPVNAAAETQVVTTLKALATVGRHRRPIPDVLIAAIAYVHAAVVLHYDRDFEDICEITRQPHDWVIPSGTGHGPGE